MCQEVPLQKGTCHLRLHLNRIGPPVHRIKHHPYKDKEGVESLSITVLQEISFKLNSVAERVVHMETMLEAIQFQ